MAISNIVSEVGVFLLRIYVLVVWNIIILYQILCRKRDCWIRINDLRVVHENQGFLVINKHPELLINCTTPWINCLTLQMQVSQFSGFLKHVLGYKNCRGDLKINVVLMYFDYFSNVN